MQIYVITTKLRQQPNVMAMISSAITPTTTVATKRFSAEDIAMAYRKQLLDAVGLLGLHLYVSVDNSTEEVE